MIRIWRAFSCNNSSAFRIVARFESAAAAEAARLELRALLDDELAGLLDVVTRPASAGAVDPGLARRCELLAQAYDWLGYSLEELEVVTHGEVLVVYQDYCLGIPAAFGAYLAEQGARLVDRPRAERPTISVLAVCGPDALVEIDRVLARMAARREHAAFDTPWGKLAGVAAGFRDAAGTVGLFLHVTPDQLRPLQAWFGEHGIDRLSIQLCEDTDGPRFAAIAAARCASCAGPLEYLDPRLHDIEVPQLLCRACGGLYDPAAVGV